MKKALLILVLLATALFLAACGGSTKPAANVTQTSAVLYVKVNAKENETGRAWIEYRVQGQATWQKTPDVYFKNDQTNATLGQKIDGLNPGTTYQYRLCGRLDPDTTTCFDSAGSGGGTNYSTFTTQSPPPPVDTDGDGVPDNQDACPNQAGTLPNGCNPAPPSGGFPDASNTGVPTGTTLTQTGGINANQPGQVISGVKAPWVDINAPNVTIRNSEIGSPGSIFPIQVVSGSVTVEDTTIDCQGGFTGIAFANYTLRRVEITGCENGGHIGSNTSVIDSWIHDLVIDGDNHTDGLQSEGGAGNILIKHNNIEKIAPEGTNGGTSPIILHTGGGAQNYNVTIEDNRLDGDDSVVALYCPRAAASNIVVRNNRMVRGWLGYTNECTGNHVTTFSGNVDDETGAAIAGGQ